MSKVSAQESEEAIRKLAVALAVSKPHEELLERPGTLTFLVEELVAQRDGLIAEIARERGGAPRKDGPVGSRWHLHWQFVSDVWSETEDYYRLSLRLVLRSRDEIPKFAAELREWIGSLEAAGLVDKQA